MQYREVGDTGIRVSALGFGTMRFKSRENAAEIIDRGLALGLTYFDIGAAYSFKSAEENAETWVGAAIQGRPREALVLSAKAQCRPDAEPKVERCIGVRDRDQMWRCIENSLQRVGVEYFDFYQFWDMSSEAHFQGACEGLDAPLRALREAKEQGLVKHIGFTSHGQPHEIIEWLKRVPDFRTITVYFNFMDRHIEDAVNFAHETGVGVKVMGPLRGGLLVGQSDAFGKHLPELADLPVQQIAFRYLLSFPGVSSVLSGMNQVEHLEENAAVASAAETMTPEQRAAFQRAFADLTGGEPLCTGCRYCQGACPQGLPVYILMGLYQAREVFHIPAAEQELAKIQEGGRQDPAKCTACGKCVDACPQNLPIPERMERLVDIVRALRGAAG